MVVPTNSRNPLQDEAWLLLALVIPVVVIRFLARIQVAGLRKLKLDDWGMKIALVSDERLDGVPAI
jgi:hypothetical protein